MFPLPTTKGIIMVFVLSAALYGLISLISSMTNFPLDLMTKLVVSVAIAAIVKIASGD